MAISFVILVESVVLVSVVLVVECICDCGYSDCNLVDGPLSLFNSDLGYNDLLFRRLCREIATVDTFRGRYTQRV